MANHEYKILSEDAIKYLCGLIRDLASVSEGIDNINLADDKTFSNIYIKNLIDKCLEDANADIVTNNGIALIARTENGKQTKSAELATMDKVVNSIIREGKSVLYNLNNVDNIEIAIDIAKSGYKPIAVSLYNSGTHLWFAQGMYFDDTVCNLSLRGVTPTSATNAECKVLVTYIKTS